MAAIIGKTGVNNAQQTGKVAVNEKTNKVKEKYTITPKQFVGGLLAGAVAFGGIAYAIKKKPAKITELLEQAKNLGSKNSDEIKKAGKKVTTKAQSAVDDVAKTASKYKQENLEALDKLGIKFNKGVAEVSGGKYSGDIVLKDKNGKNIFLNFKDGKMLEKITPDKKVVNKNGIFTYVEDLKTGNRTIYNKRSGAAKVVKDDFIIKKEGDKITDIKKKTTFFDKTGTKVIDDSVFNPGDYERLSQYHELGKKIW